jgi:hypothetical protein
LGSFRMINKTNFKTISGTDTGLTLVIAPVKPDEIKSRDDLHWQIIED